MMFKSGIEKTGTFRGKSKGLGVLALLTFMSTPVAALAQAGFVGQAAPVSCSGTVTTAATPVTPIAAQKAQNGFFLQNLDTTEPLWWSVTGPAAASTPGSFVLAANSATTFTGATIFITPQRFVLGGALSVVAATAGHKFSCIYW